MILQLVVPAVSAVAGQMMGKSSAEKDAAEKLEHIKALANLTPEQAQVVDAVKAQPLEEVRTRVALGIGPFAPLPPNASAQAQAARERRVAALATKNVGTQELTTPEERARVLAAPDREAAINAMIDEKVAQAKAARA
jgi:hypothetical protein